MTLRLGLMFAGQGAQFPGMGSDLYDAFPAARAVFDRADAILGRSVSQLCFRGTAEELTASANCQPAIYTMSLACLAALREAAAFEQVVCGGLSLGEFGALTAAGALDVREGLPLVAKRGELMDEACRATDGAMAAVLGADPDLVSRVCSDCGMDVANDNCPGQRVISGASSSLDAAVSMLAREGVKKVVKLNVAGAFHSRLMQPAADGFAPVLDACTFQQPACPVAQNVKGGLVESPDEMRENLKAQVTGSVRWHDCVAAMMGLELDMLVEVGPGSVLSGFMKRIDRRFPVARAGKADDIRTLAEKLNQ